MSIGHSKLGASATHRWMHCPGSNNLIDQLSTGGEKPDNSSAHAAQGTNAHYVGATCLEMAREPWEFSGEPWKIDGHSGVTTIEDVAAVKTYVDYVRGLPAIRLLVEHPFHCPEVDDGFFGTSDAVVFCANNVEGAWLEIVDYKHGAGVAVDPVGNTQGLQYAAGALLELIEEGRTILPDRVRITIVQPRCGGEPVRSWDTTREYVLKWVEEEWKPAAARTKTDDAPLAYGEWCRFCPAKTRCPALHGALEELKAMADVKLTELEAWEIGAALDAFEAVKILGKALNDEAYQRASKGQNVPGWKLAAKRADRVWKEGFEPKLVEAVGKENAYSAPTLLSPAAVDKLPGGKDFTRAWAYKPETGTTLVRATDMREGVAARTAKSVFGLT